VQQAEIKSESVTCDRQLVDQIRQLDSNKFEAVVWLDPTRDVFLKEHLMRGKPFLPAVMTMELFAQAVQQIRPESDVVEMSQVSVVNGLRLTEATPYKGKIRIEQIGDVFRCELLGPRPNQDVGSHQFVYSSAVLRCGNLALAEPIDVGEPVFGWTPFIYPADAAIFHGPAFHTLAKLDFQHGGGRGKVLGFGKQDLLAGLEGTAIVPAAALDGCFLLCGIFGYAMLEKAETLPYGIGSYRQYGRPRAGEMCTARIYYRETNEIGPVFDFTLVSDSNKVILTVEGYQTARIRATQ
ncbi:polyketide synthase dehydratase domain-containing protein, partial [bacterium]|nr:polyketide synthase dehydratase domain-containing protein [bacterium]